MSRLHQSVLDSSTSSQRLPALSFGQSAAGTSKPGISFPLGTGLVVLIILVVSALFSFCYHWLRLRKMGTSILPTASADSSTSQQAPQDSSDDYKAPSKLDMLQCPPVVYMAGEEMPRFIAVPCAFTAGACKGSAQDACEKSVPKSLDALMFEIRL